MARSKDLQKVRKDVESFRRKLKIAQNRLYRSWDIARTAPLDDNTYEILEQKERHFRAMKRRLTDMEENLRALRDGKIEPVKVKPWMVERPTTESHLMYFCEA